MKTENNGNFVLVISVIIFITFSILKLTILVAWSWWYIISSILFITLFSGIILGFLVSESNIMEKRRRWR